MNDVQNMPAAAGRTKLQRRVVWGLAVLGVASIAIVGVKTLADISYEQYMLEHQDDPMYDRSYGEVLDESGNVVPDYFAQTVVLETPELTSVRVAINTPNIEIRYEDLDQVVLDSDSPLAHVVLSQVNNVVEVSRENTLDCAQGGCELTSAPLRLILPKSLEQFAPDISVDIEGGGVITLNGAYGDVTIANATEILSANASLQRLDVQTAADGCTAQVAEVHELWLDVQSGTAQVVFADDARAPELVRIGVKTGRATLTLPDAGYRVQSTKSQGTVTSTVREDAKSQHQIDVNVRNGEVILNPITQKKVTERGEGARPGQ